MKRILKLLALALAVILVLVSLCGCNALDDFRQKVGTYTSSSNIKLGNNIYTKLSLSDNLSPDFGNSENNIYVTDGDVPLLLSSFLGDWYLLSEDGIFLQEMVSSEIWTYCRSDYFEQVNTQIENGFDITKYAYEYYVYDEENYEGNFEKYELSDIEIKAVFTVLEGEGEPMAEDMNILSDYCAGINGYSEDGFFYEYCFDIYEYKGQYSVVPYSEKDTVVYRVPEEMNKTFQKIMSKYIESEQVWCE